MHILVNSRYSYMYVHSGLQRYILRQRRYKIQPHSIRLISRAGLPATKHRLSTSFVTTLPAPTVAPSPIVTPGQITTAPPIQQSFPIVMGFAHSRPCEPLRSSGRNGWTGVYIWTFGPIMVRSPMVTAAEK
ncbi:hypothetical protein BDV93DRAFT_239351 [Ceratobasidium sp. AG-I]|nr:hypothetical protein BDV93DRAFT_239351 [Ceratobasidium sp. AG-I]